MKKFLGLVCAVALVFEMVNMAHAKVQIAAGGYHTIGLKSDGTVLAVGDNEYGQCNVGSWTDSGHIIAGEYHTVGLKSDGTVVAVGDNGYGQCNVKGWTLINRQPILKQIGPQQANEGKILQFTITATDPDGDELNYSASDLPTGASFDPDSQVFSWTPGYDAAGTYIVTFIITDNGDPVESDSEVVDIIVENVDQPPPEIYSIIPNNGYNKVSTQITIEGLGFQPTPIAALYGGGPYIAGECGTPGSARGLYVTGSYAYMADGKSGLQIIDISDPSAPNIIGSCDTPGEALNVYVTGSYAYVADDKSGLQIIDISDPASSSIIGTYDTPGSARSVHIAGHYAYIADNESGLYIINVTEPASPNIIGSCDTPSPAYDVYVKGSYAYVADNEGLTENKISG